MTDADFMRAMALINETYRVDLMKWTAEQWSKRFRIRPPRGMSRREWEARGRFEPEANWLLPGDLEEMREGSL